MNTSGNNYVTEQEKFHCLERVGTLKDRSQVTIACAVNTRVEAHIEIVDLSLRRWASVHGTEVF